MSKNLPKRQGKEKCCRKGTPCAKTYQFMVSHLSLGIQIQGLVQQTKYKPKHNSFIGISMIPIENFSTGYKHTIRVPGVQKAFKLRHS